MPTTPRDPVSTVRAAVKLWNDRLGPGLFGLACSGGADSMVLADAAISELGASNVIVVHIDHGLSPGSGRIATEVSRWASEHGVASVIRPVTVPRRASLEAAAREVRYAALEAVAQEVGATWTLLAHTARDQAETVLMRLVRGTGPAGLAGMPAMRSGFVRPLLETPRDVIDAYVIARGLPTWDDPMNADLRYARVRFRARYLPALRDENPAIDDALCRLAATAREWTEALDDYTEPHARFPMSCTAVRGLRGAIRKRCYARALEHAGLGYDAVHLDAIDRLVRKTVGQAPGERAVDVPGGRIVRSYGALDVERPTEATPLEAPEGYVLRPWQPGDRMKPARLKGRSRKVSDLFIDAKIPRALRRSARVLVRAQDGVIVWVEHVGLAYGVSAHLVPLPGRRGESF